MITTVALAALGGAVGTALRFLLGHFFVGAFHPGTLIANLVGSFALGLLFGQAASGDAMALWGTGVCGGLTTYSTFAVQTGDLPRRRATAYACLTIGGCLVAAWTGMTLG